MAYCPDSYDQFKKLDREQAEREKTAPKCVACEQALYGGVEAYFVDGKLYCKECIEKGWVWME